MKQTFEIRIPESSTTSLEAMVSLWKMAHREGSGKVFEFLVARKQDYLSCFFVVSESLARFFWDQIYVLFPDAEVIVGSYPIAQNCFRSRIVIRHDCSARFRDFMNMPQIDAADLLWASLAQRPLGNISALRLVIEPIADFPTPERIQEILHASRSLLAPVSSVHEEKDLEPTEEQEIPPVLGEEQDHPFLEKIIRFFLFLIKICVAIVGFFWEKFLDLFGASYHHAEQDFDDDFGHTEEKPAEEVPAPVAPSENWRHAFLREEKKGADLFFVNIELVSDSSDVQQMQEWSGDVVRSLNSIFVESDMHFVALAPKQEAEKNHRSDYGILLTAQDLTALAHIPTAQSRLPFLARVKARPIEPPAEISYTSSADLEMAKALFRGFPTRPFSLISEDRLRHVYIVGKTGMGKTTLLENMLLSDITKGHGAGIIDPHGDLLDSVLERIPTYRTNDIVIFDPSDTQNPVGFNILETQNSENAALIASGAVGVFKKMFAESWGPRLEYILRNVFLSLLVFPDATLLDIPVLLTDEHFRKRVVSHLTDPVLLRFWESEFPTITQNRSSDALGPILNKVGQFLSHSLVRNIVGQPKSGFSPRWIMDQGKILFANLPKGKIGEDASSLLGALLVTRFQIDAMSRSNIPETERRNFFLYVDEFQNFATDSFSTVLSEARKYHLGLTIAHQYVDQLPQHVRSAVFGNVGTVVAFQTGYQDAEALAPLFAHPKISAQDLANIPRYEAYVKSIYSGKPLSAFRARMNPPLPFPEKPVDTETLKRVNREKFARPRDFVEQKLFVRVTKTKKSAAEK